MVLLQSNIVSTLDQAESFAYIKKKHGGSGNTAVCESTDLWVKTYHAFEHFNSYDMEDKTRYPMYLRIDAQ